MADLSRIGEIVRRHDPDRFFTALFAPPERREVLFTLYAFNHELARAREVAREPMMALIRLQWWREVVEGARRHHEVAGPLRQALDAGLLAEADLLPLIEGREAEAGVFETLAEWSAYVRATAGGVVVAAGRALGAGAGTLDVFRDLGAAYGAGGLLRSTAALARQGRCLLPEDVLTASGLDPAGLSGLDGTCRLRTALTPLVQEGLAWLARGRRASLPPGTIAAALPAVLARHDLRDPGRAGRPRGVWQRLTVTAAALRGRI